MKNVLSAMVLSTLVLAACSDKPATITPTGPLGTTGGGTTGTTGGGTTGTTGGGTTGGGTTGTTGGGNPPSLAAALSNGPNAQSEQSAWLCAIDGQIAIGVAFFDDSTARTFNSENSFSASWSGSGNSLTIIESDGEVTQASNIQFPDANRFTATLVFDDGSSTAVDCTRDGSNGGGIEDDVVPGTPESILLTSLDSSNRIVDFWRCTQSTTTIADVTFFDDNSGLLFSFNNPDGIQMEWQFTSGDIFLSLIDGNIARFTAPQFLSNDIFTTSDLLIDGSSGNAVDCERMLN